MVSILVCHAEDPGSIPGGGEAAGACSFSSACLQTITDSFLLAVRFGRGLFGMMHHPMGTTRHAPFGNNPSLQCYNSLRKAGNLQPPPPIRVSLWGGSGAPIKDPSSPQKISHSPCLNHETWKVKMKSERILNNSLLAGINYYQGRKL